VRQTLQRRIRCVSLLGLVLVLGGFARAQKTFVLVHGAWGEGWAWQRVDSLLTRWSHRVHRPPLTGLGERSHLLTPATNLSTHIEDVVNLIRFENLHQVVLVGHSYGGAVVQGVLDRIPDRIKCIVYLDAHVLFGGESVFDAMLPTRKAALLPLVKNGVIEPPGVKGHATPPHDVPQPAATLTEKIRLVNPKRLDIPGKYILTVEDPTRPVPQVVRPCHRTRLPNRNPGSRPQSTALETAGIGWVPPDSLTRNRHRLTNSSDARKPPNPSFS
jgi:pimeloyl-ACP methyl ester carboxylesterase